MAELTPEQRKRLMPIFLDAYNASRGTRYGPDDYRDPEDKSADLHFANTANGDLKVQWTTPPTDAEQKKAAVRDHRFLASIRRALTAARLQGAIVGVVHRQTPHDKSEADAVLRALVDLVRLVRRKYGSTHADIEIPEKVLSQASDLLPKYFAEVNVVANPNAGAAPFVWLSDELGSFVPSSASRAEKALTHKAGRYGPSAHDLVLVIHFDMDAYDEDEVEAVQAALEPQLDEFREVWILRDTVVAKPTAHCVKGGS